MTKAEAYDALTEQIRNWANCFDQTDKVSIRKALTYLTGFSEALDAAIGIDRENSKDEFIRGMSKMLEDSVGKMTLCDADHTVTTARNGMSCDGTDPQRC